LALAATRTNLQAYLSRLLESHGFDVISSGPLTEDFLGGLDLTAHDVLVVDWEEDDRRLPVTLLGMLRQWRNPVVFNDSTATEISLRQSNPVFGDMLVQQINELLADRRKAGDTAGSA